MGNLVPSVNTVSMIWLRGVHSLGIPVHVHTQSTHAEGGLLSCLSPYVMVTDNVSGTHTSGIPEHVRVFTSVYVLTTRQPQSTHS
jgi:hypothetical protein